MSWNDNLTLQVWHKTVMINDNYISNLNGVIQPNLEGRECNLPFLLSLFSLNWWLILSPLSCTYSIISSLSHYHIHSLWVLYVITCCGSFATCHGSSTSSMGQAIPGSCLGLSTIHGLSNLSWVGFLHQYRPPPTSLVGLS